MEWKMTKISEDITAIKTDVSWIKKTLETHMRQHFMLRLALVGSLIASATAVLIVLL